MGQLYHCKLTPRVTSVQRVRRKSYLCGVPVWEAWKVEDDAPLLSLVWLGIGLSELGGGVVL